MKGLLYLFLTVFLVYVKMQKNITFEDLNVFNLKPMKNELLFILLRKTHFLPIVNLDVYQAYPIYI